MDIDAVAAARIAELEDQLEEAYTLIDLLHEDRDELTQENRVLRECVKRWKTQRRIEVA